MRLSGGFARKVQFLSGFSFRNGIILQVEEFNRFLSVGLFWNIIIGNKIYYKCYFKHRAYPKTYYIPNHQEFP